MSIRCSHCKGPTHLVEDSSVVLCILCGLTPGFVPADRGLALCDLCEGTGWIPSEEGRGRGCGRCASIGLVVPR